MTPDEDSGMSAAPPSTPEDQDAMPCQYCGADIHGMIGYTVSGRDGVFHNVCRDRDALRAERDAAISGRTAAVETMRADRDAAVKRAEAAENERTLVDVPTHVAERLLDRVAALEGALGPLLEAQAKHLDLGGMGSHWVGLTEAHDRARKALEGKA